MHGGSHVCNSFARAARATSPTLTLLQIALRSFTCTVQNAHGSDMPFVCIHSAWLARRTNQGPGTWCQDETLALGHFASQGTRFVMGVFAGHWFECQALFTF